MIRLGCHALVEIGRCQRQNHSAQARQIVDAQLARAAESAGRCPNMARLNQGLDDMQLAVWTAFFHGQDNNLLAKINK